MGVVSTTDVVTNPNTTIEAITNASVVCSCLPTGTSHTIDTNTDSNFVNFDTSLTYAELQTLYTLRFDDIAYYNAVDGGGA
tara:strand:+ start:13183 stop:13425 length:243 start_codon:yes stop_codon:yes gene_type:complete